MYKVVKYFTDLQDGGNPYNVGDTYPREGLKPSPGRIAELAGYENLQSKPLIEEVKKDVRKRKTTSRTKRQRER